MAIDTRFAGSAARTHSPMRLSGVVLQGVNSNSAWARTPQLFKAPETPGPALPVDGLSSPISEASPARADLEVSQPAVGTPFQVSSTRSGTIANSGDTRALKNKLEKNGITLWAVRHGQSEMNAEGTRLPGQVETPLTEKGREQALEAAQATYQNFGGEAWLRDVVAHPEKAPVVYASPLSRASDTAQIFTDYIANEAKKLGLKLEIPVHKDDRLKEISFGDVDGHPVAEAALKYPQLMGDGDLLHRFPHGESRVDVMNRVNSFLNDVADKHKNQNVMMFCHLVPVATAKMLMGDGREDRHGDLKIDRKEYPNAVPMKLTDPKPAAEELGYLFA